jgi:hypothetical protein
MMGKGSDLKPSSPLILKIRTRAEVALYNMKLYRTYEQSNESLTCPAEIHFLFVNFLVHDYIHKLRRLYQFHLKPQHLLNKDRRPMTKVDFLYHSVLPSSILTESIPWLFSPPHPSHPDPQTSSRRSTKSSDRRAWSWRKDPESVRRANPSLELVEHERR